MLRTCVLLSCSLFSFIANADNAVPANIFGHVPANTTDVASTNAIRLAMVNNGINPVNYTPASTVSLTPTNTVSPVAANAAKVTPMTNSGNPVSRIPAGTVSFAPTNTASSVPVNAVKATPMANSGNPISRIPVSIAKVAPANPISYVPTNTAKTAPAANNDIVSSPEQTDNVWLLVDTKAHRIEVKKGKQTIDTLTGIAIGRRGAGLKHHRGDDITPYGNYRIGWVGEKSNFHKFFGLNYPSVQDAEIALKRGTISERNYYDIVAAHHLNLVPPQDTPLGGKIGIHGIGAGDEKVHQLFDWTHGCIALTNEQIDHLSQWLDTGTVVKIR